MSASPMRPMRRGDATRAVTPRRCVTFLRSYVHVTPATVLESRTADGAVHHVCDIPESRYEYKRGQIVTFGSVRAAADFVRAHNALASGVCAVGELQVLPVHHTFGAWRVNATCEEFQGELSRVRGENYHPSHATPSDAMMREAGRRTFLRDAMHRGHSPANQDFAFECFKCGGSAYLAPDLTIVETGTLASGECAR